MGGAPGRSQRERYEERWFFKKKKKGKEKRQKKVSREKKRDNTGIVKAREKRWQISSNVSSNSFGGPC